MHYYSSKRLSQIHYQVWGDLVNTLAVPGPPASLALMIATQFVVWNRTHTFLGAPSDNSTPRSLVTASQTNNTRRSLTLTTSQPKIFYFFILKVKFIFYLGLWIFKALIYTKIVAQFRARFAHDQVGTSSRHRCLGQSRDILKVV